MSEALGSAWRGEHFAALWQSLVEGRPLTAGAAPLLADLVALAALAMLLETMVLLRWHRRTGRGLPARTLLPTMLAGGAWSLHSITRTSECRAMLSISCNIPISGACTGLGVYW